MIYQPPAATGKSKKLHLTKSVFSFALSVFSIRLQSTVLFPRCDGLTNGRTRA